METALQQETEKLARSWTQYDPSMLREYLVAGEEDPRLNVQSLLARQFLLRALFGEKCQELLDQELRFAVALNWLLELSRQHPHLDEARAVLHGLKTGADDAEGIAIPFHIRRIYAALPAVANGLEVPNYLEACLTGERWSDRPRQALEDALTVFPALWSRMLAGEPCPQPALSVLEVACGSANDYRGLEACGLARLIDYTGLDLCETNVRNARALFPAARFQVGNVFALDAPDQAFDCLLAHDLFEHLSLAGLETAIKEVCRVTRRGMCLGFFNAAEVADHLVRPVDEYHWNTLSVERLRASFAARGFQAQVVHIGTFLRWAAACDRTHNPHAYTFLLRA